MAGDRGPAVDRGAVALVASLRHLGGRAGRSSGGPAGDPPYRPRLWQTRRAAGLAGPPAGGPHRAAARGTSGHRPVASLAPHHRAVGPGGPTGRGTPRGTTGLPVGGPAGQRRSLHQHPQPLHRSGPMGREGHGRRGLGGRSRRQRPTAGAGPAGTPARPRPAVRPQAVSGRHGAAQALRTLAPGHPEPDTSGPGPGAAEPPPASHPPHRPRQHQEPGTDATGAGRHPAGQRGRRRLGRGPVAHPARAAGAAIAAGRAQHCRDPPPGPGPRQRAAQRRPVAQHRQLDRDRPAPAGRGHGHQASMAGRPGAWNGPVRTGTTRYPGGARTTRCRPAHGRRRHLVGGTAGQPQRRAGGLWATHHPHPGQRVHAPGPASAHPAGAGRLRQRRTQRNGIPRRRGRLAGA